MHPILAGEENLVQNKVSWDPRRELTFVIADQLQMDHILCGRKASQIISYQIGQSWSEPSMFAGQGGPKGDLEFSSEDEFGS